MRCLAWLRARGIDRVACLVLVACGAIPLGLHLYLSIAKMSFTAPLVDPEYLNDFFVFFSASRFILDGGPAAELYDIVAFKRFQIGIGLAPARLATFNYPPHYIFFVLPLSVLPYYPAMLAWSGATLLLFLGAARIAGLRGIELLALAVAPATVVNIAAGQNGFLTSALLVAGLFLMERRPVLAGSLFGLLTAKPHLGVLIPVAALAQRNWRLVLAAAVSVAILIGASILAFGPAAWTGFAGFAAEFRQAEGPFLNLSATVQMGARLAGLPAAQAYLLQIAVSLGVAATLYRLYRTTSDRTLLHAALLTGTMLASPFGFVYDLPFLGLAVILLVRSGLREGFPPYERVVLALAWLAPIIGLSQSAPGPLATPFILLCLFGLIALRAWRPRAVVTGAAAA
jgi:hypothetical protein